MPKSLFSVLLLLSSVSPAPSYAVAVGFLTQVQNPTFIYTCGVLLGGGGHAWMSEPGVTEGLCLQALKSIWVSSSLKTLHTALSAL